jgi:hypothetical protein
MRKRPPDPPPALAVAARPTRPDPARLRSLAALALRLARAKIRTKRGD